MSGSIVQFRGSHIHCKTYQVWCQGILLCILLYPSMHPFLIMPNRSLASEQWSCTLISSCIDGSRLSKLIVSCCLLLKLDCCILGLQHVRIVRVLRTLRVLKRIDSMRLMLTALSAAVAPVTSAFFLMFLVTAVYSVSSMFGFLQPTLGLSLRH